MAADDLVSSVPFGAESGVLRLHVASMPMRDVEPQGEQAADAA